MKFGEFAKGVRDEIVRNEDGMRPKSYRLFFYSHGKKFTNEEQDIADCDIIVITLAITWNDIYIKTIEAIKRFGLENGFELTSIGVEGNDWSFEFHKV